ncbi:MAG: ATP-dependent helicase UvrD/PcrA [Acidimicrobiaceae bacterium]|nr:ATP-dependent helicase UvrD/PcrA [Acidimicrobiaceae bacterium]
MFELNRQQQAAVSHRGGPLLVQAGAGTGKTGTLASRVADLIDSGVPPGRICLLTFTRRAAQEMLTRAGHLTTPAAAAQVWGGTFHAVAHRVLRLHGRRLGLSAAFSVLDQADATEVLALVRHDVLAEQAAEQAARRAGGPHGAGGRRFPRPDTLASIYSRVVSTADALSSVVERDFPWCRQEVAGIRLIFEGYTARKRARQMLDFEDLLLALRGIGATTAGAELLAGLWDQVLVDEYQDTNQLQADILALLRPDGTGLTIVGDDAQAIYGFRAATARNMEVFVDRFPGTTVVRLEENYRSIPPILAVANAIMAAGTSPPAGGAKVLWSQRDGSARPRLRFCEDEAFQAEAVCDSVLAHREDGVMLRRQAVLFRASHHADLVELALTRRNIPYVKYGGLRILEAAHVKDLVALLRLLDNPWDEVAWFRILPLLEGVGPTTARRVMADLGLPVAPTTRAAPAPTLAGPITVGPPAPTGPIAVGPPPTMAAPIAVGPSVPTGPIAPTSPTGPTGPTGPIAPTGPIPTGPIAPTASTPALMWSGNDPAASPLARLLAAPPRLPEAAANAVAGLRRALGECADNCLPGGETPAPGVQVERLSRWLGPVIERKYSSPAARSSDLDRLARVAAGYCDRGQFVAELTLDPPAATGDLAGPPLLDEDWLLLSTVHSAKGGEWDVVHVIHAADGMFPSDMACGDIESIEEERRLMYVAVTRARDVLEINVPRRYHVARDQFRRLSDRHLYAQVSRFLTDEVQALMDIEQAGAPIPHDDPASGATAASGGGMALVDQFLSGLWA